VWSPPQASEIPHHEVEFGSELECIGDVTGRLQASVASVQENHTSAECHMHPVEMDACDIREDRADQIFTSIFPMFPPRMSCRKASTELSMPSTTVSSNTTSPDASHGPIFAANSGKKCV